MSCSLLTLIGLDKELSGMRLKSIFLIWPIIFGSPVSADGLDEVSINSLDKILPWIRERLAGDTELVYEGTNAFHTWHKCRLTMRVKGEPQDGLYELVVDDNDAASDSGATSDFGPHSNASGAGEPSDAGDSQLPEGAFHVALNQDSKSNRDVFFAMMHPGIEITLAGRIYGKGSHKADYLRILLDSQNQPVKATGRGSDIWNLDDKVVVCNQLTLRSRRPKKSNFPMVTQLP
ncbi:MAG: hypothetical protein C5B49_16220 [Bdellovibrio sp.]|nr:MAG: hypothetical protein C5B49_16220 [Bdellovibrio sp.]